MLEFKLQVEKSKIHIIVYKEKLSTTYPTGRLYFELISREKIKVTSKFQKKEFSHFDDRSKDDAMI